MDVCTPLAQCLQDIGSIQVQSKKISKDECFALCDAFIYLVNLHTPCEYNTLYIRYYIHKPLPITARQKCHRFIEVTLLACSDYIAKLLAVGV